MCDWAVDVGVNVGGGWLAGLAGTAAIGISENKIVVLSATDEEQPVAQTASVMTLDENTSAFAVDGLEYYVYNYNTTSAVGPYLLSIFSCANDSDNSSINTTGHAFLTIKNCACTSIIVGGITVAPYEEISAHGEIRSHIPEFGII